MIVPVTVNDYKLDKFREIIQANGFTIVKTRKLAKTILFISVKVDNNEQLMKLHRICKDLNDEVRIDRPRKKL